MSSEIAILNEAGRVRRMIPGITPPAGKNFGGGVKSADLGFALELRIYDLVRSCERFRWLAMIDGAEYWYEPDLGDYLEWNSPPDWIESHRKLAEQAFIDKRDSLLAQGQADNKGSHGNPETPGSAHN